MLHHAQGISGELPYGNPADPHGVIKLRNAPSGGGLYPVTLFVHALAVDGTRPGHATSTCRTRTRCDRCGCPAAAPDRRAVRSPDLDINRAGLALTFVYNLYHNSRKYGDSGVVFGLIEVGAILQNLHLARTALALAGCDQGGYDKQRIEQALGLDGHTRHVVHVTVIGQEG